MRLRLLADRMVRNRELGVSEAKVAVVVPAENRAYRERITSPLFATTFPNRTVSEIVRETLVDPDSTYATISQSTLAGAVLTGGRKALRRLRGQEELRLRDAAVEYLAARAVATVRAMLARGHAAVEPVPIEAAVKESLASDASPPWRAPWRTAHGKAAWSDLSRPPPKGVAGLARAETVKKVAAALEDGL